MRWHDNASWAWMAPMMLAAAILLAVVVYAVVRLARRAA
jgi:hypothetical protein